MGRIGSYEPPGDLLEGRTILVTGAGDGIGRAVAIAAAAVGAQVVLLGRTVSKLEAVYDAVESAGGSGTSILPMDLERADESSYESVAACLEERYGALHGLVHCAGSLGTLTPLEQQDLEEWRRVLEVNLNAVFALTRSCLPLMRDTPGSSIVFVSSGVGRSGRAYWGPYAVSKAGVESLNRTLAEELEAQHSVGRAPRVNCLNPGPVRTAMRLAAYPAEDRDRLIEPEDVAWAFLYLLGNDSAELHGESLDVQ